MDSAASNRYELQLYSVFKTFDVDNEEALDRPAVLQLCDTLQLDDRGAALVDTLFDGRTDRVTFSQFRNGLLSVLGGEPARSASAGPPGAEPAGAGPPGASPPHSDDDSSGREVAPRFVFGSKKYGRRSRPQRPAPQGSPRHRVASESRLDCGRARHRARCKRSASAMESRDERAGDDEAADLDHDRRVDRERALALCRGLRMRGVDRSLVDRVFVSSSAEEISVGDFFDRLNASLATSIAASLDGVSPDELSRSETDIVAGDAVAETWERAGVQKPRRLLTELGFTTAALHPDELERALDDELRTLATPQEAPADARSLLLLASNALARMRLEAARRQLDAARAERDKLREDLAEADRRAGLLAQDVDENHARIEVELQSGLRQAEARHAEAARAAATEAAAERERAEAARLALEEEAARRAEAEARLRANADALRDRVAELQEREKASEERASVALRERARSAEEAREAEGRAAALAERERARADELSARLLGLRAENRRLRDRLDELGAALEAGAGRAGGGRGAAPSWREEVAMEAGARAASPAALEEPGMSSDLQEKKKYSSAIIDRVRLVSDGSGGLPIGQDRPTCSGVADPVPVLRQIAREPGPGPAAPAAGREAGSQTEPDFEEDIDALRGELVEVKRKHDLDKQSMLSSIKELEASLQQMKLECERCEDYWAAKLDDEREAFADEQRAGDERLAELVAKIAEYERQFARPALPPIAETGLELQVEQLEADLARLREEKEEAVRQLERKVEELERRPERRPEPRAEPRPEPPAERRPLLLHCERAHDQPACACAGAAWARWRAAAGAREAGALRARAARAERAAQRLHARLAAADLLVKDLYIENCRLAHQPQQHQHQPRLP